MKTQILAAVLIGWLPGTGTASRRAAAGWPAGCAQHPPARQVRGQDRAQEAAARRVVEGIGQRHALIGSATGKRPCGRHIRTSTISRMLETSATLARGSRVVGDLRHQDRAEEAAADRAQAADDDDDEDEHDHLAADAGGQRLAVERPHVPPSPASAEPATNTATNRRRMR